VEKKFRRRAGKGGVGGKKTQSPSPKKKKPAGRGKTVSHAKPTQLETPQRDRTGRRTNMPLKGNPERNSGKGKGLDERKKKGDLIKRPSLGTPNGGGGSFKVFKKGFFNPGKKKKNHDCKKKMEGCISLTLPRIQTGGWARQ